LNGYSTVRAEEVENLVTRETLTVWAVSRKIDEQDATKVEDFWGV
jgi:hypothetical protein